MTETFEKIIGSVANGDLDKMVKSEELTEKLTGLGIVYSLNLSNAIKSYVSTELDDACADR